MSILDKKDLSRYIGHEIVCVGYGIGNNNGYANVSVECENCNEILLDFDE